MNKNIAILLLLAIFPLLSTAQNFDEYVRQHQANFSAYNDKVSKEFEEYRQKINAEYAKYMRKKWEAFETFKSEKSPMGVKPKIQPEKKPNYTPPTIPRIKFDSVVEMPQPIPISPKRPEIKTIPDYIPIFSFDFFGTPCQVRLDKSIAFSLNEITGNAVADEWLLLSDGRTDLLVTDCLSLKYDLELCDWAYIVMLEKMSSAILEGQPNEAVLLQMYILVQSGYKVRIAIADNTLFLLIPFDGRIYELDYITIERERFYVIGDKKHHGNYQAFGKAFPNEQTPSLRMGKLPKFSESAKEYKSFTSERYPEVSVKVAPNKNLMDFLETYPLCTWDYYAYASLSESVKKELYPILRTKIANKSVADAANMLINFVQTAFEYKTDDEQFGYERPLFGDEIFYYPFSDCEDRSILYSILVHDLLGLDVLLLHFPGHLATAVYFPEEVDGTYLTLDGKKYTVCDPTYIDADIGECMPEYIEEDFRIYMLK
jgi:hypothetical protein